MEQQKKVVKIVKHYEDGSTDTISGVALDNYNTNMDIANGICLTRSYINFKPVEWVLESGGTLTDGTKETVEEAVKNLGNEITNRQQAFILAHNTLLDDDDEQQEKISEFDLEDGVYEDVLDLCELYHQLRNGTANRL